MAPKYSPLLIDRGIQWDERGSPYYSREDGGRDYLPPIVAAQYDDPRTKEWAREHGATVDFSSPSGPAVTTGAPGGAVWNSEKGKYEKHFPVDAVALGGIGALFGAPLLGGLLGGSGAAGSAGGNMSIGSILGTVGQGIGIASAGKNLLGGSGGGQQGGSQQGGGGATDSRNSWLGPILGSLPLLMAGLGGAGQKQARTELPPELSALLAQSLGRQQQQTPLSEAVSRQAFMGLPAYARNGISPPGPTPPVSFPMSQAASAAAPSGDGGFPWATLLAGIAGTLGGSALGASGVNLPGAIGSLLGRLFGAGDKNEPAFTLPPDVAFSGGELVNTATGGPGTLQGTYEPPLPPAPYDPFGGMFDPKTDYSPWTGPDAPEWPPLPWTPSDVAS